MKKITVIIIAGLMIGLYCFASWLDTHYTREGCEVISYAEDVVTVEDSNGEQWNFIGDGYEVGDIVDLQMYTNHTDNYIYDDEVIEVE